jgi:SAM-dependent methyltransferase
MNVERLKKMVPKAALPYLRRVRGARHGTSEPDPTYVWFGHNYGEFHLDEDYEHLAINNLDKPSGGIRGCIVHFCAQLPRPGSVLLPGEPSALRDVYADMLGMRADGIVTAGLMDDADFCWNFEEEPPAMGTYDLILSQAMLEHLIDPYKHMRDLAQLLSPGGHLVMLTVLPGFAYHRHPIDCVRFFPDWFEEVAQRLSLDVVDKLIWQQRIVYCFRRQLARSAPLTASA